MAYIPSVAPMNKLQSSTITAITTDLKTAYPGVDFTVNTNELDTLHNLGNTILGVDSYMNQTVNTLMNRIGRVELISLEWTNPLAKLRRGVLELGDIIEELYVAPATGAPEKLHFTEASDHSDPFAITLPEVNAKFHVINYAVKYRATITRQQLRQAFTTWSGLDSLIAQEVASLAVGHNRDEFLTTKYILCKSILEAIGDGTENSRVVNVYDANATTKAAKADNIVEAARGLVESMGFLVDDYTVAKVESATSQDKLQCFTTIDTNKLVDVNSLASAFNLQYKDYLAQRVTINRLTFTDSEKAKLYKLFGWTASDDSKWFTPTEIETLTTVKAVICDVRFVQIWDLFEPYFTSVHNGEDDYWNYFLHVKKSFGRSPFVNSAVILEKAPVTAQSK